MIANNCGNPVTTNPALVRFKRIESRVKVAVRAGLVKAWISALFPLLLLSCNHTEKLDLARLKRWHGAGFS